MKRVLSRLVSFEERKIAYDQSISRDRSDYSGNIDVGVLHGREHGQIWYLQIKHEGNIQKGTKTAKKTRRIRRMTSPNETKPMKSSIDF
jgi:hypothetical protein